jgi:hypothetical protein
MHGANGIDTLQRDMNSRDAIISFQCFANNLVRVIEILHGKGIQCHQEIQRHPEVVTEWEQRYIFFAEEAEMAGEISSLVIPVRSASTFGSPTQPKTANLKGLRVHLAEGFGTPEPVHPT